MKKLIATVLTLALIFAVSTTAFAAEEEEALPAAKLAEVTEVIFGDCDDVLVGSSKDTRETTLPTSYWSLAQNSYKANLQVVGKSWLYTNYYYHPNGDGKIFVNYDVKAKEGTTTLYIGLYDLVQNELVVVFPVDGIEEGGTTGSMYFYNLVQSHNYAVCFRAHPTALNGKAEIKH